MGRQTSNFVCASIGTIIRLPVFYLSITFDGVAYFEAADQLTLFKELKFIVREFCFIYNLLASLYYRLLSVYMPEQIFSIYN